MVGATERGLCWLALAGTSAEAEASLRAEFPAATLHPDPSLSGLVDAALAVVSSQPDNSERSAAPQVPPQLDLRGTAFQLRVWQALRAIPRGQTRSYSQLAREMGIPNSTRAVEYMLDEVHVHTQNHHPHPAWIFGSRSSGFESLAGHGSDDNCSPQGARYERKSLPICSVRPLWRAGWRCPLRRTSRTRRCDIRLTGHPASSYWRTDQNIPPPARHSGRARDQTEAYRIVARARRGAQVARPPCEPCCIRRLTPPTGAIGIQLSNAGQTLPPARHSGGATYLTAIDKIHHNDSRSPANAN